MIGDNMERLYCNKGYKYILNDNNYTAKIVKGHIGRVVTYRIADHVIVDGIRYEIDSIAAGAYNHPRSLKHLIIPDSIVYLDEDTLNFLPNLRSIHIGKGLKYIGHWHFRSCPKLRSIQIDKKNPNMKRYENMVISADGRVLMTSLFNRKHYNIPNGIEEIESVAFMNNTRLNNINFPTSLRKIGECCFSDTGIVELRLPEGLECCMCQVFMECENLEIIDFPSTFKSFSTGWEILSGCKNLKKLILRSDSLIEIDDLMTYFEDVDIRQCALYVPQHLRGAYLNHPQWGHFNKIVQIL